MQRYASPLEWIQATNKLIRTRDLDNVTLLAGEPGNGKSTLMYQIAKAFDPTFNVDRVHFTTQDFLNDARAREKYQAVAADELFMHRRHSATKSTKDMIDFLQVCRGLNLHLLLCFPHAGALDRMILDRRVRYRIDVERRDGDDYGLAILSERHYRTLHDRSGQETYAVNWTELLRWKFYKNTGPEWEDYQAKKIAAARQRDADARGYGDVHEMDDADYESFLAERGLRKGRRKGTLRRIKDDGKPKTLRDVLEANRSSGRHPKDCGVARACPTGAHHAAGSENPQESGLPDKA